MKWDKVKLGDYISTLKGFAFKSAKYTMNGIPIVRASNFTMDSISFDDIKYYSKEDAEKHNKYKLDAFDVLVQTVGSWQNNPASVVGKVISVPTSFIGALLNQNIVKLSPLDSESLDNRFLYYRLKNNDFKQHNLGNAVGAANQASITLDTIKAFQFELPPIEAQCRIAAILLAYDDLIKNNQKQIKLLEEAAMRLYKEWFVNLRFPGYENTKIVDGVPEGWQQGTFENICKQIKVTVKIKDLKPNIPYIGLEHMPRKSICFSEWSDASLVNSNKFSFRENDVLFGKIRPYFHKVGFAIIDGVASTDAMIFRAEENMFGLLLTTAFSDAFVKYTSTACKEGAKMPRADWNEMKNYQVLIPTESILKRYDMQVINLCMMIKALCKQIILLRQARDKLLSKLMSGEIEV